MDLENDIRECIAVLKKGGLILYPTDTVWGIGCDATHEEAVDKIFRLKKRPDQKAMIVLVADEKQVREYVAAPDPQVFDHLAKTKKPTTVIYEQARGLTANLKAQDGSIAIRICRDEFCVQLIRQFGKPVVSTSANFSGEPVAGNFKEIPEGIVQGVDYVVKQRQDDETCAEPSSVIRWENGILNILRH